jgi:Flp pilus assembly protein TadG
MRLLTSKLGRRGGDSVTLSPCHLVTLSPGHRTGAAATELAVLLPFLGLMFLVAVDFCRIFYCTQTVAGCAQAGALYACGAARREHGVSAEDAGKQAAVAEGTTLDPPLTLGDVTVTTDSSSATVTVSYAFRTISRYPGLPNPVMVTRTVKMNLAPRAPGDS